VRFSKLWAVIAGDSRLAPIGVAVAVVTMAAVARVAHGAEPWAGVVFVAILIVGLVAGVFEKT